MVFLVFFLQTHAYLLITIVRYPLEWLLFHISINSFFHWIVHAAQILRDSMIVLLEFNNSFCAAHGQRHRASEEESWSESERKCPVKERENERERKAISINNENLWWGNAKLRVLCQLRANRSEFIFVSIHSNWEFAFIRIFVCFSFAIHSE